MAMTSRERMLTALDNKRPDRLPCQVHGWMDYYLKTYLGGADWYEANRRLGFDYAIYVSPTYRYEPETLGEGLHASVEYEFVADGEQMYIIKDALGTQDREVFEELERRAKEQ